MLPAAMLVAVLAGCDDGGAASDVDTYCALTREIDEPAELVDDVDLDAITGAAPEPIADDVQFVAARFRGADASDIDEILADPEVVAHLGPIERFEREECGIEGGSDEPPHTHDVDRPRPKYSEPSPLAGGSSDA